MQRMKPYTFMVAMYAVGTRFDTFVKAVNAYKSEKRAEQSCDMLNDYATDDPVYGKVYFKVQPAC